MSEFELAINTILQHEGEFSNNADDAGGATKYGISQRFLSDLLQKQITVNDIQNLSQQDAILIYQSQWWNKFNYSAIVSQSVAIKLFDLAVNMGAYNAHRCLQRACWSAKGRVMRELTDDGNLGAITFHIVNGLKSELLLPAIRSEAAGYYRSLHQSTFENGWLTRAYS